MLDTVLLVAYLNCSPPKKWDIIQLLSKPNRCHEASCKPLLTKQGAAYAEALLWLYRSKVRLSLTPFTLKPPAARRSLCLSLVLTSAHILHVALSPGSA